MTRVGAMELGLDRAHAIFHIWPMVDLDQRSSNLPQEKSPVPVDVIKELLGQAA